MQKLCMLSVLGVFVLMTLKQWKSDVSLVLRIGLIVLLGMVALSALSPVIEYAARLWSDSNKRYITILFKALGMAFLTHYAAEICRECGESGLASGVETVGKMEILILCIPLMEELLQTADRLLNLGG